MGTDPAAQDLIEHRESTDIIGEVTCRVRDLEAAWQQEKDRQMNQVTREAAAAVIEFDIAAPRPAVWEHFTQPGATAEMAGGRRGARDFAERPARGRDRQSLHAQSSRHHRGGTGLRALDYTISTLLPMPDALKVIMSYAFLEENPGDAYRGPGEAEAEGPRVS